MYDKITGEILIRQPNENLSSSHTPWAPVGGLHLESNIPIVVPAKPTSPITERIARGLRADAGLGDGYFVAIHHWKTTWLRINLKRWNNHASFKRRKMPSRRDLEIMSIKETARSKAFHKSSATLCGNIAEMGRNEAALKGFGTDS